MIVAFDHEVKTGGTCVVHAVSQAMPHVRVPWGETGPSELQDGKFYSSHHAFPPWAIQQTKMRQPRDEMFYFTWSRKIEDQLASAWRYYRQNPVEIVDFSGLGEEVKRIRASESFADFVDAYLKNPFWTPDRDLELRRNEYDFIGRCEHMEEDLQTLANRIGIELSYPGIVNASA